MIVEGFMKEATFDLSLGIVWFSLGAQTVESAHNVEDPVLIPESRRSLREGNGNPLQYSCWKIPWMEEPGGLQSMGWQRVGQDCD